MRASTNRQVSGWAHRKDGSGNDWGAYKNGALLRLAEDEYDLFITADKNIRYQQNLAGRKIAIIVLSTNHWETIRTNSDKIIAAVQSITPTDYVELLLA